MNNMFRESDAEMVFTSYPKFFLEAVSLYFPLPIEWMRKYADILLWGQCYNADICCCSSMEVYSPGILFNSSVDWTPDLRVLLFANLSAKGGGLSVDELVYTLSDNSDRTKICNSRRDYEMSSCRYQCVFDLLDLVMRAPLGAEDEINNYARALHRHHLNEYSSTHPDRDPYDEEFVSRFPDYWESRDERACRIIAKQKYAPTITGPLALLDVAALLSNGKMPSLMHNPDLWRLTLVHMLNRNNVERILFELYTDHLKSDG